MDDVASPYDFATPLASKTILRVAARRRWPILTVRPAGRARGTLGARNAIKRLYTRPSFLVRRAFNPCRSQILPAPVSCRGGPVALLGFERRRLLFGIRVV